MSSSDEHMNLLYRQIIMDHYQHPRNKGLTGAPDYYTVHLKNPSCGDDLSVQVKLEGDRVADVRHIGDGCSICCSSSSMMSELLKGETVEQALATIASFKHMASAEPYDADLLKEAVSLHGVAQLPARVKCATLAWIAAETAIRRDEEQARQPAATSTPSQPTGQDETRTS
ncbi:MAG: SUF system NifU family Fe-S cluster assembly protein [Oscillospiraceae bacterium]|nr:SUF system NifU family Fe-S cluster assembly protein [Oscillospiraceae bacterium]MDD4369277.1 SUF system NifU family Fe-S cluster assembly protein [Oscillospiraceae bacterium]